MWRIPGLAPANPFTARFVAAGGPFTRARVGLYAKNDWARAPGPTVMYDSFFSSRPIVSSATAAGETPMKKDKGRVWARSTRRSTGNTAGGFAPHGGAA